jgi:glycosyltransferase involved in cell wall biosynthesis
MPPSLAIGIPAYNEEATLEKLAQDSLAVLRQLSSDYEVVIIDDGSTDATGRIADRLAEEDPHVRVVHHSRNLGFGETLREVWSTPWTDWVFFIPGDGQIPPTEINKLWRYHEQADFILGWRTQRQDPWRRRMVARTYNVLISLWASRWIHDVDSVVLFRRALLEGLSLRASSVFIHAEFLLEALRQGAVLKEIPIEHRPRAAGEARGNRPGVIWATFREAMHYRLTHLK